MTDICLTISYRHGQLSAIMQSIELGKVGILNS